MDISRTFNHIGEKIQVTFSFPDNMEQANQDMNGYIARRNAITEEDELIKFRASEFDKRAGFVSKPKEQILDAAKANVMFQVFENFLVSEKN